MWTQNRTVDSRLYENLAVMYAVWRGIYTKVT